LKKRKIAVIGAGYVGMSLSVLLGQKNKVKILDINDKRVSLINRNQSTVSDTIITEYLDNKNIDIQATLNISDALTEASFIIICTPTDYNEESDSFDTSSVELSIKNSLKYNDHCLIIIKSTVPTGFTESINKKFNTNRVIFSPEFLREGNALYDNLYPSRIIIGSNKNEAKVFANLLIEGSLKKDCPIICMTSTEAEAVKLFSNTYLAMRVAYFNELDSYAIKQNLNSENLINGVCLDDRIGMGYNNPSFGYGGYCLPKDTKQLLSNFILSETPQNLISAVVSSNDSRKSFLANIIIEKKIDILGIYRINMKEGSDNFRSSAIQDIINKISNDVREIIIFEPSYPKEFFNEIRVVNNLEDFKIQSDLVLANRLSEDISDIHEKVFTRDIFKEN
jgi:UDPglucose 6-dehydrogenase